MESGNFLTNRYEGGGLRPVRTSIESGENVKEIEEEELPLSPWAAAFREAASDLYVICILGSKIKLQPNFIKENLLHSLLINPRFSCLQVTDANTRKMKWVKTRINLEEHMIVARVNKENMEESPHTFLENYLSNLTKTPMDSSKPLWELHLLNCTLYDSESIVVFRVHHSLGDGFTLLFHLLSCTRKISDPMSLPSFPVKINIPKQSNIAAVGVWKDYFIKFWNTLIDIFMLMGTIWFLKDTKTPITRSSTCTRPISRRFVCKIFSLDDLKVIKNATNTTINDVILAVIQAGLSVYLNRIYADGKIMNGATAMENNLPQKLRLRAIVPISLRYGLPMKTEQMNAKDKNKKGNQFGYVLLPLTIAIKDDPLEYVHSAKAAMDRKKNSLEAILTSTIVKFLLHFLGIKGASVFSHRIPSHTTMVFSNMPGPREEIAYLGYPISFIAPTSYGLPNALSMHVLSYFDKVSIMLSVDENTISNPHQLGADLEQSFKLIKDAAIVTATPE